MSKTVLSPAARKARRRHIVSLLVMAVVLIVFLILTTFLDLPPLALTALYLALLAAGAGAMWSTMSVMISRRGDDG